MHCERFLWLEAYSRKGAGHIPFWLEGRGSRETTIRSVHHNCPRARTRTHVASLRKPEAMYRTAAPRPCQYNSIERKNFRPSAQRGRGLDPTVRRRSLRVPTARGNSDKNKIQSRLFLRSQFYSGS